MGFSTFLLADCLFRDVKKVWAADEEEMEKEDWGAKGG